MGMPKGCFAAATSVENAAKYGGIVVDWIRVEVNDSPTGKRSRNHVSQTTESG